MGGGGSSGQTSVPAGEQVLNISWRPLPIPDLHQRSDQVSHHVLEEGRPLDLEDPFIDGASFQRQPVESSKGGLALAIGGPKRREVVAPQKHFRRLAHALDGERPVNQPVAVAQQRIPRGSIQDPVAIVLAHRIAAGIETLGRFGRLQHRDILGQ